jgi:hypothetical protein
MKNILILDSGTMDTKDILNSLLENSNGELKNLNVVILRRKPDLKQWSMLKSKKVEFEGDHYIAYYNHRLNLEEDVQRIDLDPLAKNFEKEIQVNNNNKDTFKTVCAYSSRVYNDPMMIDDYEFNWRSDFLKNLSNLYDTVENQGLKMRFKNVYEQSPKLFIRDILTEFTVKNIFKTTDTIPTGNRLIHIMNKIMKSLYEQFYKDSGIRLYFVYRGGNILKTYKTNFENVIPGKTKKFFKEEFDDFFKFSDIDFYTVIEGSENMMPEEIYKINIYIQMMCYYGCYLSRIFIMNNPQLFNFCKINEPEIKELYDHLLDKINEDKQKSEWSEVKNANFIGIGFNKYFYMKKKKISLDKILELPASKVSQEFIENIDDIGVIENYRKYGKSGRFDINILPSPLQDFVFINKMKYIQEPLTKENYNKDIKKLLKISPIFDFYITNNNQIYNKEEYVNFSLVRLMINYTLAYERDGKYGLTNGSSELFDLSIGNPDDKMYKVYISKNLTPYQFKYDEEGNKDEIYIPSLETTLLDLISILFEYRDFPWEDQKYEKRLYRLLILVFIKELPKYKIEDLRKKLLSKSRRKYKNMEDIDFDTIRYRNDELKELSSYLKDEKKNYQDYENKFDQIVKKLINIIDKIHKYEKDQHKLEVKDIYNFDS